MATMRPATLAPLMALCVAAVHVGCAATGRPAGATRIAQPAAITLLVRNYNWLQVNVYVLRATTRHRLGTVSSMGTEIFRIPRHLYASTGTLLLRADPIGSHQTFTTDPIPVGLTRQIELTVAESLPFSRLMVR